MSPLRRITLTPFGITGNNMAYGLRADLWPAGYALQSDVGCIDATLSIPSGQIRCMPSGNRTVFVHDAPVLRCLGRVARAGAT